QYLRRRDRDDVARLIVGALCEVEDGFRLREALKVDVDVRADADTEVVSFEVPAHLEAAVDGLASVIFDQMARVVRHQRKGFERPDPVGAGRPALLIRSE